MPVPFLELMQPFILSKEVPDSFPVNFWEGLHSVYSRAPLRAIQMLLPYANLVAPQLEHMSLAGYISSEVMVAGLATLNRLRDLSIRI